MTNIQKIELTKQLRILENDLRKSNNDLFFDTLQIDEDTKKEIAELTNEYNFKVLTGRKFRLQIIVNHIIYSQIYELYNIKDMSNLDI